MLNPKLTSDWLCFEDFRSRYVKALVEEYPNSVPRTVAEPVVSVLIVTYQHSEYIRDCINGVLTQKADFPIEIVIGDDESTDGTREICLEFAERYPGQIRFFLHKRQNNIRILDRPTGIFQVAYNLFNCRGKFLAICSGDDYWQDELKLQKQVAYLEANPSVSFSYHDHIRFFPETGVTKGPFGVDRIQTVVGRNIFSKLPEEFLEVMQEDTFLKFFWRQTGVAKYVEDIAPAVIRFHSRSMYTSLDSQNTHSHRKNVWKKIAKACENDHKTRRAAEKKLVEVILYQYRNNRNPPFTRKIREIIAELKEEKCLMVGAMQVFLLSLKKLTFVNNKNEKRGGSMRFV